MINILRVRQFLNSHRSYRQAGRGILASTGLSILKVLIFLNKKNSDIAQWQPGDVFDVVATNLDVQSSNNNLFDESRRAQLSTSLGSLKSKKQSQPLFIWSIPHWTNVWGGGHYTLFRFIDYFTRKHGVENVIYIYDYKSALKTSKEMEDELNSVFCTNGFKLITSIEHLPASDAAICTTWQSAYNVIKMHSKNKFYFMQDYESLFYAAGTKALQANYSYSFGFHGITGGNWLKRNYESYGSKAQAYVFSADRDIFYPIDEKALIRKEVKRIFFYGRPSTERRAYELGIQALELISKKYPEIEIVIAGLSGIEIRHFKCTLLGNLTLKETGDLYRSCDIGIALSATNMSYLPVELMASGCPVISNEGPQVEWFCKNEHNSLLVAPTPSALLDGVVRLVNSFELRYSLASQGLRTIRQTTWEDEMEKIYQYVGQVIKNNEHQNPEQNLSEDLIPTFERSV